MDINQLREAEASGINPYAKRDSHTVQSARAANTVHVPGAPAQDTPTVGYVASRRCITARTDEDAAMAYWNSGRHSTRFEATQALVEHMLAEARHFLTLSSKPSENLVSHALELAQLAGAMGTTVASDADLEQVTSSAGVCWAVRRITIG